MHYVVMHFIFFNKYRKSRGISDKIHCFYQNSIKQLTITYGFSISSSSTHIYKQGLNQILKMSTPPFYLNISMLHSTH